MTDTHTIVGARTTPSLLHLVGETALALAHSAKIIALLKMRENDKGFAIVLNNGKELKISDGYQFEGGLLQFAHSTGPQSMSFARIARVVSNE